MKSKIKFYISDKYYQELGDEEDERQVDTRPFFSLVLFSTFGIIILFLFCFANVSAKTFRVIAQAKSELNVIKTLGTEVQADVSNFNLDQAQTKLNQINEKIVILKKTIYSVPLPARVLLPIVNKITGLNHGIDSLEKGTQIGMNLVDVYKRLTEFNYNLTGTVSNSADNLNAVAIDLQNTKTALFQIKQNLDKINKFFLDSEAREQLDSIQNMLPLAEKRMSDTEDSFKIIRDFAQGNKTILVVFQNNNELRPTGGFIGTVGQFKISDGKIVSTNIHSVYDLDGQLKQRYIPPKPLFAVNDHWFLRDSNWFADFSESAKKISLFYEREGGETPDYVIAATPEIITDLLQIVGPTYLPTYKVTLDSQNFIEKTQVFTSVNYDKISNTPKQMIADLFVELVNKATSPGFEKSNLIPLVVSSVLKKSALVYSTNSEIQSAVSRLSLDGKITPTSGDYLYTVFANLGGTKTDLQISTSTKLTTTIKEDGRLINNLEITRLNSLEVGTLTENKSYLRIFIPKNSKIISINGFDPAPFQLSSVKTSGIQDKEVLSMEYNDLPTEGNANISSESGLTTIGGWVLLPGKSQKTVKIEYLQGEKFDNSSPLTLLIQKQPGIQNYKFDYKIKYKSFEKTLTALTQSSNPYKVNFDTQTQGEKENSSIDLERDLFYATTFELPE